MKRVLFLAGLILIIASCSSSKYLTSSYERLAPGHHLIAVLPFENIYTGRMPEDVIEEDFNELILQDAYFFQQSLYGQLLEESGIRDGDIFIDVQDVSKTNRILKEEGIHVFDLAETDAADLSQLLNVDAIVKVTLHKNFLLTDEESVLVDIAGHVYRDVIKGPLGWKTWGADKTGEIFINASIIDGREALAVWNLTRNTHTDWKRHMDHVVADINNHISKKFPYRK